jgi:hypothetical protein
VLIRKIVKLIHNGILTQIHWVFAFESITQIIILVQWCGLHLLMFPVLLDPALPLDAPPYTLFMSKLTMTDNAAQMLQWKQLRAHAVRANLNA